MNNQGPEKKTVFGNLLNALSFGREVRQLVEILNSETPAREDIKFRPISHPAGFSNLISQRQLTIADAYVRLLSHSEDPSYVGRIEALQTLMHHIRYSENIAMPLNTARVQLALMKNTVKMKSNRRAQLEMMSDFIWASTGKGRAIRQLLRELDLIEVPETTETLAEQMLTWDDHLHISMSEGRKSPTLLVVNAFIKGLSRFTVSFYDFSDMQKIEEIYLACDIMGIRGQVGIEFSVGPKSARQAYLFIPPQTKSYDQLTSFLDAHADQLKPFYDGLAENARRRRETIRIIVDRINTQVIPEFNADYADLDALKLAPIPWEDVESITQSSLVTRTQLGMLIFKAMHPIALKRVLYLENEYKTLAANTPEAQTCKTRYEDAHKFLEDLTPTYCATRYLVDETVIDYPSAFETESDILPLLHETGGYVAFIRVLRRGLPKAIDTLFAQYKNLNDIEIYNMVCAHQAGLENYTKFAMLLHAIHDGEDAVVNFLKSEGMDARAPEEIAALCAHVQAHPFYTRCASDSVGWSTQIPGMGFFHEFLFSSSAFKTIQQNDHKTLPQPIADLLKAHRPKDIKQKQVYLLSAMQKNGEWVDGDLVSSNAITPKTIWRYMNSELKNTLKVGIGFIPTYLCLGIEFALIWFFLTAFRNALVDLIASGIGPRNWKLKIIDRRNLTTSLFFTGFSVPIMSAAKLGFDWLWTHPLGLESTGFWFTLIKFCVIALANGCYLATHNTLRGFAKPAIRGNFFRSVLSWPLATAMSYVLTPLGVPDVVQAKMASEVVAGIIEGTVKYRRQARLAQNAVLEVYSQVRSSVAITSLAARLDILYFWNYYNFSHRILEKFITSPDSLKKLTDAQREDIKETNQCLIHAFTDKTSLMTVTYAILEHYPEDDIKVLTRFAGETYLPFANWLSHALPEQSLRTDTENN
ncbi:MAG: hypothetical protein IKY83_03235 [Proteobacteria bacterium]|nr:hypothetical protein [Pseudomonadota bacterium]